MGLKYMINLTFITRKMFYILLVLYLNPIFRCCNAEILDSGGIGYDEKVSVRMPLGMACESDFMSKISYIDHDRLIASCQGRIYYIEKDKDDVSFADAYDKVLEKLAETYYYLNVEADDSNYEKTSRYLNLIYKLIECGDNYPYLLFEENHILNFSGFENFSVCDLDPNGRVKRYDKLLYFDIVMQSILYLDNAGSIVHGDEKIIVDYKDTECDGKGQRILFLADSKIYLTCLATYNNYSFNDKHDDYELKIATYEIRRDGDIENICEKKLRRAVGATFLKKHTNKMAYFTLCREEYEDWPDPDFCNARDVIVFNPQNCNIKKQIKIPAGIHLLDLTMMENEVAILSKEGVVFYRIL